jgi:hypothetical protein
MSGLSATFLPLGEAGGLRFIPIGSEEGGFDEFRELSLRRFSRSLQVLESGASMPCR